MADKKITELNELTTPTSSDLLPIVDDPAGSPETKKITFGNVESNLNHTNIQNVGTNTHAQIDTHLADTTKHFTEASIDHTAIQNIGTLTHAQIDAIHASRVRAYQSTAQTIADSTTTQVNLQTESYDNLGEFASNTFTATKAGYYLLNGQVQAKVLGAGTTLRVLIYVNSSSVAVSNIHAGGNLALNANTMTIQYLAVNDTVKLYVYHTAGASKDLQEGDDNTFLEVHRLS